MANTGPAWPPCSLQEQFERSLQFNPSPYSSLDNSYRKRQCRSGSSTPTSTPALSRRATPPYSRHSTPSTPVLSRKSTPPCSRHTAPHSRSRLLGVPRQSSESLAGSVASSRASTPSRSTRRQHRRSCSPRPRSESDALESPVVQQEAFTRAILYPSSLHRNLRLAAMVFVMAHVSFKTLVPWALSPILSRLSFDWTPRSVSVGIP